MSDEYDLAMQGERKEIAKELERLASELAEAERKREEYALQVCLLLDAMREAGVHIDKKWCWCGPLVESHADSKEVVTLPGESRQHAIERLAWERNGLMTTADSADEVQK